MEQFKWNTAITVPFLHTKSKKTLDLEQTPDDKLYKALDYQP